jgi:capsular exopolysaccharide synthesis family protein
LPQTTAVRLPQTTVNSSAPPVAYVPAMGVGTGGGGGGGGGRAQMTGADVWRVIRANLLLIIVMVILAGIGGFFLNRFLAQNYPHYTATGYLQIRTSVVRDAVKDETSELADQGVIRLARTQAALLQTDTLFSNVLKKNGRLRDTKWFAYFQEIDPATNKPRIDIKEAREYLQDYFRVSPVPDSELLAARFSWEDPKDCKIVIEEIVNEHLEQQKKQSQSRLDEQTRVLRDMSDRYAKQVQIIGERVRGRIGELTKQGLGSQLGTGNWSEKEQRMGALIKEQLEIAGKAAEFKKMAEKVQAQLQSGAVPAAVEQDVERDNTVARMAIQLAESEVRLESMRGLYGTENREVKQMERWVEATRNRLADERASQRIKLGNQYLEEVTGRAESLAASAESLDKQINQLRDELATLSRELALYLIDQEEEKSLRELQTEVNNRLRDVELTHNPENQTRIGWAPNGQPEIPELPSFPRLAITLPLSLLLGLGLALGIAFLREFLDDTVRSPRDVARVGQMNLLGMISDENDDPQVANAKLPIFDAPHSLTAEQFRQVRTRLAHAAALDTTRSIMVTGPSPMDGKTTVAANLAAGLALNGRRILLVDGNFRRPEMHRLFGFGNDKGFSDVLNGTAAFEDVVHQTRVPNLSIMTSGPKPMNATELFESQLLIDFIERALEDYDHVIFDSGPFLVVSESIAMAPRVDGVVTVVRAHAESRGLLLRMREQLRQVKAEHIGVVLNAVRAQGGGYYRRNIKTYYLYNNEA